MFKFAAAAILAVLPGALAVPTPRDSSPPAGFNITGLTITGSGCPAGSTYYALNVDNTAVTVTFSEFFAEAGPGIPYSATRSECDLKFNIDVPSGYSFGVTTIDYRGYYQLDDKVTAEQESSYSFPGVRSKAVAHSTLIGPVDGDDYTYRDTFNLTTNNYSPCGQNTALNVQSTLNVNNWKNQEGSGYISTDSIDTSLTTTYSFQWQTCRSGGGYGGPGHW